MTWGEINFSRLSNVYDTNSRSIQKETASVGTVEFFGIKLEFKYYYK